MKDCKLIELLTQIINKTDKEKCVFNININIPKTCDKCESSKLRRLIEKIEEVLDEKN